MYWKFHNILLLISAFLLGFELTRRCCVTMVTFPILFIPIMTFQVCSSSLLGGGSIWYAAGECDISLPCPPVQQHLPPLQAVPPPPLPLLSLVSSQQPPCYGVSEAASEGHSWWAPLSLCPSSLSSPYPSLPSWSQPTMEDKWMWMFYGNRVNA